MVSPIGSNHTLSGNIHMIFPKSFLNRLVTFAGTAAALVYLVACLPQGGKEERIKKKAGAEAHSHEEEPKTSDASPLKDCVEADPKAGLLVTHDDEEEGHEGEEHEEEGHEGEEHEEAEAKVPAKKEDCKKKETTTAKPEEHGHDHD